MKAIRKVVLSMCWGRQFQAWPGRTNIVSQVNRKLGDARDWWRKKTEFYGQRHAQEMESEGQGRGSKAMVSNFI